MDEITHLYLMVDRIREAQLAHTAMLRELLRRSRTPAGRDSTPSPKWLPLLKSIGNSAGQWAGGVLAMAYVLKGGDLITAIQTLLKLFS